MAEKTSKKSHKKQSAKTARSVELKLEKVAAEAIEAAQKAVKKARKAAKAGSKDARARAEDVARDLEKVVNEATPAKAKSAKSVPAKSAPVINPASAASKPPTLVELRAQAKSKGITGYSRMTRAILVERLK